MNDFFCKIKLISWSFFCFQILQMLNDLNPGVREAAILCIEVSATCGMFITALTQLIKHHTHLFRIWTSGQTNPTVIFQEMYFGQQVVLAASLLHASGFFFGYVLSRMLGIDVASSRTISIEVGMQVYCYCSWIPKFCPISGSQAWTNLLGRLSFSISN